MTYKTEDEMIEGGDMLNLEAVSQSLEFLANSADEVAAVLKCASPQDQDKLEAEIRTMRHALRRLIREVDGDRFRRD